MATKTELRAEMDATLDGATDAQLIAMHTIAYTMLWAASLDETPVITTTMAAIETQFERRGIPHCSDCGCPNGRHEPDFCSEGR